jgi:hypothetical protein
MASKDSVPKSGRGSKASRLSDSPLTIRRGNADPIDVHPRPVQTDAGERHDYEVWVEPKPEPPPYAPSR